jgi:hypothetical protein
LFFSVHSWRIHTRYASTGGWLRVEFRINQ